LPKSLTRIQRDLLDLADVLSGVPLPFYVPLSLAQLVAVDE